MDTLKYHGTSRMYSSAMRQKRSTLPLLQDAHDPKRIDLSLDRDHRVVARAILSRSRQRFSSRVSEKSADGGNL